MVTVYTICAVAGAVIMIAQLVMMLTGMDADSSDVAEMGDDLEMGDEYVDTHSLSTFFFGILTFRSIVAAVTFFGLGGRIALGFGVPSFLALSVAFAVGLAAMVVVAWLMQLLHGLHDEGNVRIQNCVGAHGSVYLTVPAANAGVGKVTISVQNRSIEYAAVTNGEAIPTGARIVVSGISDPNTLEVELNKQSATN